VRRTCRMQIYSTNAYTLHANMSKKGEVTVQHLVSSPRDRTIDSSFRPRTKVPVSHRDSETQLRDHSACDHDHNPLSSLFQWCCSFPEHLTISFSPLILHPDGRRTPIQYCAEYVCMRARSLKRWWHPARCGTGSSRVPLLVRQAAILTASGYRLLPEGSRLRLMVKHCPK